MTEITDEIRAGVLRAIARNMSLDYAARADGITVAQAEQIARAAGWPDDMTQVHREWQQLRAELEYFGRVPPKGPTPERGEKLEDYVARVAGPIETLVAVDLQLPPGHRVELDTTPLLEFDPDKPETYSCAQPGGDCGCTGTGLLACPGREAWIEEEEVDLVPVDQPLEQVVRPLPPATDSPVRTKPKPRQVPCEVCDRGVLVSYVEANGGRQRHGHHPEVSG